jgi:hypothetical protein
MHAAKIAKVVHLGYSRCSHHAPPDEESTVVQMFRLRIYSVLLKAYYELFSSLIFQSNTSMRRTQLPAYHNDNTYSPSSYISIVLLLARDIYRASLPLSLVPTVENTSHPSIYNPTSRGGPRYDAPSS